MFKAVYDPKRQEAGAYLIDNAEHARPSTISIAELEKLTGIRIFPTVGKQVKANLMKLPEPKTYKERRRKGFQLWFMHHQNRVIPLGQTKIALAKLQLIR
ncbi:MAG: hypothetical protein VB050_18165 [Geobacteraceae bacterium]|nr:hypothetical protein [Geobacteraceae bacterium]